MWFAHPFHPLVSLVLMLTPPLLGWLCPKGQVTRAQEAEENYLVKRELATIKQQSEEADAALEHAKKTIRQLQQQQQQPNVVRRATDSPARMLAQRGRSQVTQRLGYFPGQFVLCSTDTSDWSGHISTTGSSKNVFHYKWHVSQLFPHSCPHQACNVEQQNPSSVRAGLSSLFTPALGYNLFWHAWIQIGTHITMQFSHHVQSCASSEMYSWISNHLWLKDFTHRTLFLRRILLHIYQAHIVNYWWLDSRW